MKIIKGDTVKIISGKDKGRQGSVVKSFPKENKIIVSGLNLFKKHLKPQKGQKGGIVEKERPIFVPKVVLICPECKKATRVSYRFDKSHTKYRYCRQCQAIITLAKTAK